MKSLDRRLADLEARIGVAESVNLEMSDGSTATLIIRSTEALALVVDAMERHHRGEPLPPKGELIRRSVADDTNHHLFDVIRSMCTDRKLEDVCGETL